MVERLRGVVIFPSICALLARTAIEMESTTTQKQKPGVFPGFCS